MKMKKIFLLLLFGICLIACEKDPIFRPEELQVEVEEYIDSISYHSADIYCTVEANVSVKKVVLEYSLDSNMKKAQNIILDMLYQDQFSTEFDPPLYYVHLTSLQENTTYYCRVLIETSIETIIGKDSIQFITKSLSESAVVTKEATDITLTSATLNGMVTTGEGINLSTCGFYYSTNVDMTNSISITSNKAVIFKSTIDGLTPNIHYYYRAFAVIDGKEYYGTILDFITLDYTEAHVITGDVINVNFVSSEVSITLQEEGNTKVTEIGICYSEENEEPTYQLDKKVMLNTFNLGQTYEIKLSNLKDGTKYVYRAYSVNEAGISYGDAKAFTTLKIMPIEITIGEVENIKWDKSNTDRWAWPVWATFNFQVHIYGQPILGYYLTYKYVLDGEDKENTYWFEKSGSSSQFLWEDEEYVLVVRKALNLFYGSTDNLCVISVVYIDANGEQKIEASNSFIFPSPEYQLVDVETLDVISYTASSAQLRMRLSNTANTGCSSYFRGFYYSDNPYCLLYDYEDSSVWTKKWCNGETKNYVGPLNSGTTYYYTAFVQSAAGMSYGEVKSFIMQ